MDLDTVAVSTVLDIVVVVSETSNVHIADKRHSSW